MTDKQFWQIIENQYKHRRLIDIIDTTNEPNILQKMKIPKQDKYEKPLGGKPLGRKPIADKKVMLRMFVEQSTVDANGGEQSCKDECILFLKERWQKSFKKKR